MHSKDEWHRRDDHLAFAGLCTLATNVTVEPAWNGNGRRKEVNTTHPRETLRAEGESGSIPVAQSQALVVEAKQKDIPLPPSSVAKSTTRTTAPHMYPPPPQVSEALLSPLLTTRSCKDRAEHVYQPLDNVSDSEPGVRHPLVQIAAQNSGRPTASRPAQQKTDRNTDMLIAVAYRAANWNRETGPQAVDEGLRSSNALGMRLTRSQGN